MQTTVPDVIDPGLVQQEINASTREVLAFVEANKVTVVDQASLVRAADVRRAIGDKQKAITAQLAKPKSWAHGLHAWFCALERSALAPLAILDGFEREQIRAYDEAQTRARQERERTIAEARRIADQERATSEAAALERIGEHQLAAAVMEEAITAQAPVVVLEDTVRQVQSFRRTWHFEIVDEAEVPRDFCVVDTVKLGRYAVAMKGSGKVPGVRFFYTDDPIR